MVVCTLHLSEATCLNHNSLHHQMHRIFRNADAKVDIFLETPKYIWYFNTFFVPLASPKVLSFGKAQINLAFHSFIRTFAPYLRYMRYARH